MDHKFTEEIGKWLDMPDDEKDWEKGALYMLKLSGNKILYQNVIRNIGRRHDTIVYNIRKYYNFRVRNLTHEQVKEMSEKVEKIAEEKLSLAEKSENKAKGKRPDHDKLPDEIKACYVENLSITRKMRELHLKLRSLSVADAPCPDSERYPFLQEIISLDNKLSQNYKTYDEYVIQESPDPKPEKKKVAKKKSVK